LCPFRGFSLRTAFLPFQEELPPCRCAPEDSPAETDSICECLDFEALLRTKQRGHSLGLTAPQLAPLIGLRLLQVLLLPRTHWLPNGIRS
jgi:hypothetical protein